MASSNRIVSGAVLSGLITYALFWVAGEEFDWLPLAPDLLRALPGVFFGLLVLGQAARSAMRGLALVVASGVTWYLMYHMAVSLAADYQESTLFACGVAGGLGAWLVSLMVRVLVPRRLSLLAMLMAFVLGTLGGSMIGQATLEPELNLLAQSLLISGFVLWQAGVGCSLLLMDELGAHEAHA